MKSDQRPDPGHDHRAGDGLPPMMTFRLKHDPVAGEHATRIRVPPGMETSVGAVGAAPVTSIAPATPAPGVAPATPAPGVAPVPVGAPVPCRWPTPVTARTAPTASIATAPATTRQRLDSGSRDSRSGSRP
jgi:hypothetical protein